MKTSAAPRVFHATKIIMIAPHITAMVMRVRGALALLPCSYTLSGRRSRIDFGMGWG
ncbi:MAG TPA: hypothetical protein VF771_00465 [Longimicrobiaceae bacterium]